MLKIFYKLLGTGAVLLSIANSPVAATTVSAGFSHTCAVSDAGAAMCWGSLQAQGLGSQKVIDVKSGRDYSCALLSTGNVSCWGKNDYSQLGAPSGTGISQPVSGVSNAIQIAAGERHACALLTSGDVYCWGDGSLGQLGEPVVAASASAVKVQGLRNATQIAAGSGSTCAVMQDGTARCLGSGSLLSDSASTPTAPLQLPNINDASSISIADGHACILRKNGGVSCWGKNVNGELGIPASNTVSSEPVEVSGLGGRARSVAAGLGYTCAVLESGRISCWGANAKGQLGTGYPLNASQAPTPVIGITDAMSVSTGVEHTCAVLNGGYVNCWGSPANNRLGVAVCNTTSADYPGYIYTKGPISNGGACLSSSTGAITPYAVQIFSPNRDIALVLNWANRSIPSVFSSSVFPESLDNIQNFYLSDYKNGRFVATNAHGTPKLIFLGPESGDSIVDLGPIAEWVKEAKK